MVVCPICNLGYAEDTCPNCGQSSTGGGAGDETLDQLVEGASIPNLATLFQQAKDNGLMGPVSIYGEGYVAPAAAATP